MASGLGKYRASRLYNVKATFPGAYRPERRNANLEDAPIVVCGGAATTPYHVKQLGAKRHHGIYRATILVSDHVIMLSD